MTSTRKKTFAINSTPFNLDSTETEFNKRKNSSTIIRETLISNKAVEGFSSKPSGVGFYFLIDKSSKQKSPCSSKIKNCPVNEVEQTAKPSDDQINTKEIKCTTTLYRKTMKNKGKVLHLFLGTQQCLDL